MSWLLIYELFSTFAVAAVGFLAGYAFRSMQEAKAAADEAEHDLAEALEKFERQRRKAHLN